MEAHSAIHCYTEIRHNAHINKALEGIDCREPCEIAISLLINLVENH